MIQLKRAYEPRARGDGRRVLVDRLWPRGIRKQDLEIDAWDKEIAPSPELRKWFAHDPARWSEFKQRYRQELKKGPAPQRLAELARQARDGAVTLVYSTRDPEHNNAVVLREEIERLAHTRRATTKRHPAS
jgi:uncharacterized protein YeaO (DUF488 family)